VSKIDHLRRRGGDLRMMGDVMRPARHQVVLLLEILHGGMHLASLHREFRHLQQTILSSKDRAQIKTFK